MTDLEQLKQDVTQALLCFFLFGAFTGAIVCIFIQMILKAAKCTHKNIVTRTIWSAVSCEQTANFCADCGKQLSETKTDCR